jgi:hypothetical protein
MIYELRLMIWKRKEETSEHMRRKLRISAWFRLARAQGNTCTTRDVHLFYRKLFFSNMLRIIWRTAANEKCYPALNHARISDCGLRIGDRPAAARLASGPLPRACAGRFYKQTQFRAGPLVSKGGLRQTKPNLGRMGYLGDGGLPPDRENVPNKPNFREWAGAGVGCTSKANSCHVPIRRSAFPGEQIVRNKPNLGRGKTNGKFLVGKEL